MASWDVFTLLEGGYRMHEGQSPGGGFRNPVGRWATVDDGTTPAMPGMYSGYPSRHYHQVSETSNWVLLCRDS